jgi:hypothetical protein
MAARYTTTPKQLSYHLFWAPERTESKLRTLESYAQRISTYNAVEHNGKSLAHQSAKMIRYQPNEFCSAPR